MKIKCIEDSSFCIRSTPFGLIAVLWSFFKSQPKILRIVLSSPDMSAEQRLSHLFSDSVSNSVHAIDVIVDDIEKFLKGHEITFSLDTIRLDLCSGFQQRVLSVDHGIPRGKVSTYGRIAVHLGNPNGVRAVGNALANNPFPIVIPCHRVIRSDGSLGGYQGGLKMKRALLLEMEGVVFDDNGSIAEELFYY
jgi:methylated-DNA-[protein]-cysteine S-methyltransferase